MNPILADFVTHMEFLGYEVKQEGDNQIRTTHPTYGKTSVKAYQAGVLFQQYYLTSDAAKADRPRYLEAINGNNSESNVATYVAVKIGDDEILRIDGLYLGSYEKQKFALFLDKYNFDSQERVIRNDAMSAFIA